ncbi:MAG TPA: hypothetical protein VHL09_16565 [Dehalococcoidia bacterium]|nr:hypothetical protein [Dehalococcoidia bacterium]
MERNQRQPTPRRRRGDLRVGRLEQELGLDFGVRSDMLLRTLRDRLGERELQRLMAAACPAGQTADPDVSDAAPADTPEATAGSDLRPAA